jgi:hypothetical protein
MYSGINCGLRRSERKQEQAGAKRIETCNNNLRCEKNNQRKS